MKRMLPPLIFIFIVLGIVDFMRLKVFNPASSASKYASVSGAFRSFKHSRKFKHKENFIRVRGEKCITEVFNFKLYNEKGQRQIGMWVEGGTQKDYGYYYVFDGLKKGRYTLGLTTPFGETKFQKINLEKNQTLQAKRLLNHSPTDQSFLTANFTTRDTIYFINEQGNMTCLQDWNKIYYASNGVMIKNIALSRNERYVNTHILNERFLWKLQEIESTLKDNHVSILDETGVYENYIFYKNGRSKIYTVPSEIANEINTDFGWELSGSTRSFYRRRG